MYYLSDIYTSPFVKCLFILTVYLSTDVYELFLTSILYVCLCVCWQPYREDFPPNDGSFPQLLVAGNYVWVFSQLKLSTSMASKASSLHLRNIFCCHFFSCYCSSVLFSYSNSVSTLNFHILTFFLSSGRIPWTGVLILYLNVRNCLPVALSPLSTNLVMFSILEVLHCP